MATENPVMNNASALADLFSFIEARLDRVYHVKIPAEHASVFEDITSIGIPSVWGAMLTFVPENTVTVCGHRGDISLPWGAPVVNPLTQEDREERLAQIAQFEQRAKDDVQRMREAVEKSPWPAKDGYSK